MTAQLSEAEIRKLVDRIVSLTGPDRVILFGSYAKGRATARSDLDLLVVLPDGSSGWRPCDLEPFVNGSIVPVDIHIVSTEELQEYGREQHHFLNSVLLSGLVMYERAA
jgi:predicted nucleotidyltransferase